MALREWLASAVLRWDRNTLIRRGVWGDTHETVEFLLDRLPTRRLHSLSLPQLKSVTLRTRFPNIDLLVQALASARWVMSEQEEAVPDIHRKYSDFDRTLDEYLISTHEVPIRPEEAVRRLHDELLPFMEQLLLMYSNDDVRHGYYVRQYDWLLREARSFLEALLRTLYPSLPH